MTLSLYRRGLGRFPRRQAGPQLPRLPTRRCELPWFGAAVLRAQVRRVCKARLRGDSRGVLVDRLWPRGVSKAAANFDEGCEAVVPSSELRTWHRHDPERFAEFTHRYLEELRTADRAVALIHLRSLAKSRTLTLLTVSKQRENSGAAVLADLLRGPT